VDEVREHMRSLSRKISSVVAAGIQ
jgi:hypothetical protein